jgi:hypothetical protein
MSTDRDQSIPARRQPLDDRSMDDLLMQRADERGFISRPEIIERGFGDRDIRHAIASGILVRIGAGLYAPAPAYRALTDDAKLASRSRAVFHRHRGAVVLTHQSAAAIHGREVSREPGKRGVQLQPWQLVHVAGINPGRASPPPPLIGKQLPCTPVPEDEEEGSAETGSAKDTAGLTACVF